MHAKDHLKNLPMILKSKPSEQLNTTHCFARAFARSFVVSVLPVPAGPAGAPPKSSYNQTWHIKFLKLITKFLQKAQKSVPGGIYTQGLRQGVREVHRTRAQEVLGPMRMKVYTLSFS